MPVIPIFRYADAQARIRARLGAMPDEADWRYISDASDLDNLIERMRGKGLAHWLTDLPRSPETQTIERCLLQHLLSLLLNLGNLLPVRWRGVDHWLVCAGNLAWAQRLLVDPEAEAPQRIDPVLKPIFALPVDQRAEQLRQTPYDRYLSSRSPFDRWLSDFEQAHPSVSGREAYVLARIVRQVESHRSQLLVLRKGAALSPDPAGQWRLREQLAQGLRVLVGGDPFHAGLVLIYGLLEALQFERCRALLVARSCGWARPEFPGSAT